MQKLKGIEEAKKKKRGKQIRSGREIPVELLGRWRKKTEVWRLQ